LLTVHIEVVIALWDALFSDAKTFDFLMHVCCSMIM
jgi:hypothetical protein